MNSLQVLVQFALTAFLNQFLYSLFNIVTFSNCHVVHVLLYALSMQTLIGFSLQVLLLLNRSDYLDIYTLLTDDDRAVVICLQLELGFLVYCLTKLSHYVRASSLRLRLRPLLQLVLGISLWKLHFQD